MISRVIFKDKPKELTFRSLVKDFFRENPDIDTATVSIEKGKPKRSNAQNRLYWSWVSIIAEEIGYSKTQMHLILADRFLDKIEFDTKKGKKISQIPSTRDLNVMQFVDYLYEIEDMFEGSGEWNIRLPRGEDYQLAIYGNNDGRTQSREVR
jgi:hypothetical protein|tara:strand:- start:485 stop:940 length:456 start_codon:yes stop_codon:yes gene_type:complete